MAGDEPTRTLSSSILDKYSVCYEVLDEHQVPLAGLVFEETLNTHEDGLELEDTSEPYQRAGNIFAQWEFPQGEANIDLRLLLHMLDDAYKSCSYQQLSTQAFGMNIYQGINSAKYVRPTPRKSASSILKSEKWRENQMPLYLPLLHHCMDILTCHGMMFARASDSVYDDFQREILSKSQDGDKIKCNNSPGEQYNIIQIITGPDKDFSGFFNEDHIDCFDKYENGFHNIGIAYIAKCHKECIKSLKARDLTNCNENIRCKKICQ